MNHRKRSLLSCPFRFAVSALLVISALARLGCTSVAVAQSIIATGGFSPGGLGPASTTVAATVSVGNGVGVTGSLQISDGANLTAQGLLLAGFTSSTATTTLTGAGTTVIITNGTTTVGGSGTGVLNVNAGASYSQNGLPNNSLLIARNVGSSGAVNVNGGQMTVQRTDNTAFIGVGGNGNGALNITNGGVLTLGNVTTGTGVATGANLNIGGDAATNIAGQGAMTVSGAGSRVDLLGTNQFTNVGRVGAGATGSLTVNNGGVANLGTFLSVGRGRANADVILPTTPAVPARLT
jgi:T5SS/PEP-CTERM-associated repeat protein